MLIAGNVWDPKKKEQKKYKTPQKSCTMGPSLKCMFHAAIAESNQ